MIRVEELNLSFGAGHDDHQVLFDVNFDVPKGEIFGLVGESGSGKSTVLRCIAGLYTHWTGKIDVNGHPIGGKIQKSHYRQIQMVFQDPYGSLHPRHTIDSTLSSPLKIHGIGDINRRVNTILEQVGLPLAARYRYPHQLSGGQRQRVAIARALILEPSVLLLDEPTSALDVSVQAEILNLLSDVRKERGLTYIMVSHDLSVIAHLCDRLAVMQGGRIEEILPVSQLMSGDAQQDYTRTLYEASRSYDRAMADDLTRGRVRTKAT
ncbi:ABC transporter ATP-binding protein [Rhizobium sp. CG4]|uniref:ABC transporter ATP-binding protein n=1 Tax=Rhizobium sp. CG4 TaxID=2726075 RepID=UPI003328EC54|nr:ABC transporter ATP-binding protein [Rhizobium sp. CG4]